MQPNDGSDTAKQHETSADDNQEAQILTPSTLDAIGKWLAFSNAAYILACLFAVFATFGIVYFGNKYTRLKEYELENYKRQADSRIADANKQAADANALAAAARADAETARTEGEKFRTERAALELRLHQMEQSQSALTATNKTSQAEINRLKEAAKPRVISEKQKSDIAVLLKTFSGQEVVIRIYSLENEAQDFGQEVAATLRSAGLKTQVNSMLGGVGRGFGVVVHDGPSAPPLAGTIQHAFGAAGIPMDGLALPEQVEQGKFFIAVGAKPAVP